MSSEGYILTIASKVCKGRAHRVTVTLEEGGGSQEWQRNMRAVLGGSGITSGLTSEPVVVDRVTEAMEMLEVSVGSQALRGRYVLE